MTKDFLLTKNKNFKPCSVDDGDEIYPNGIFEFNITKMMAFIQQNKSAVVQENIEVKSCRTDFPNKNLNESTVESANLSNPVILAEISPQRYNLIDGHHRIEKALRLGVKRIPAYKLAAPQHIHFLTSLKAYSSYVDYWNTKVKEQMELYNGQ